MSGVDGEADPMRRVARAHVLARAGATAAAGAEYRGALTTAAGLLAAGREAEAEPVFRAALVAGIEAAAAGLARCLRARGATGALRALVAQVSGDGADPLVRALVLECAPPEEPIAVRGLRFAAAEEWLALRCAGCGAEWEEALPSWLCSLPVVCGGCGSAARIEPEALAAAAARYDPPLTTPVADALDAGVTRLVAEWHGAPALADGLRVAGVNLGAAAELALFPVVLDAVVRAYRRVT
jgi:hypothetical protein